MKITVLVDNNTTVDNYYQGEPAVCYYIEDDGANILFDAGYTDLFLKNAKALDIDLASISTVVLSHGHNDHTRGLKYLINKVPLHNTKLVAHPDVFNPRVENGIAIGSPLSEKKVAKVIDLDLQSIPVQVSKNILFLGEIPTFCEFEQRKTFGSISRSDGEHEDYIMDDSAIVYKGNNGLFIITGCSHSGICNIIEYAKMVCNDNRIAGVIGGFHLFDVSERLQHTIEYFIKNDIKELYPCHCVSFRAKAEIHKHIPIHEVGVGLTIEID